MKSAGPEIAAEFLGTALLVATVVGSGIMAERLAGGNVALALLCNTLPTGAILFVLITMFGPISGAHFNPVVTGVFWCQGEIPGRLALLFCLAQVAGGIAGTLVAHLMFELPVFQLGMKVRAGPAQLFAEWVATFGLLLTILLTRRVQGANVAASVGTQKNNLDKKETNQMNRYIGSVNVSYAPTNKLNLNASYSNFTTFTLIRPVGRIIKTPGSFAAVRS